MRQIDRYLLDIRKQYEEEKSHIDQEQDMTFKALIFLFAEATGEWLAAKRDDNHPLYSDMLELYFEVLMFMMAAELYDDHYTTITEIRGSDVTITLFCLDPTEIIANGLSRAKSSILFSATLTPLSYYRSILGGSEDEDSTIGLPLPFDQHHLLAVTHGGISTKYVDRDSSYAPIAQSIYTATAQKRGNYLVFFPSYEYMHKVYEHFTAQYPDIATLLQQNHMDEEERADFLARFDADNSTTLIGFAVLGGIFSEGIDLKGDRLIGAVIVGTGIPKVTLRQEQIRHYFDQKNGQGYDYAYTYPGMNKVLQAAGRVIRTEQDCGLVLLIDRRFTTASYRSLFPHHWSHMKTIRNSGELVRLIGEFPHFSS